MKFFLSFAVLAALAVSSLEGRGVGVKVIGGDDVVAKEAPFVVSIRVGTGQNPKVFKCAGSLIGLKHVLTAATCLVDGEGKPLPKEQFEVVAGDLSLSTENEEGEQKATVADLALHPNWNSRSDINDIAILELATPLDETDWVKAVALPSEQKALPFTSGTLLGWGDDGVEEDNGGGSSIKALSDTLKKAELQINENAACQTRFDAMFKDGRHFCAGSPTSAAAIGDNGAPLIVAGAVYGIVSVSTAETDETGSLFTRVGASLCWINSVLGNEEDESCKAATTTTEAETESTTNSEDIQTTPDGGEGGNTTPDGGEGGNTTPDGGEGERTTQAGDNTTAGGINLKFNLLLVIFTIPLLAIR